MVPANRKETPKTTPKAITSARRQARDTATALANARQRLDAALAAEAAVQQRVAAVERQGARQPILVSGATIRLVPNGLGAYGVSLGYNAKLPDKPTPKSLAKRVLAGEYRVSLAGGNDQAAKGVTMKARYATREDLRAIKARQAAVDRARAALVKAEAALTAELTAAYANGTRIAVEDVAIFAAKRTLARRGPNSYSTWTARHDVESAERFNTIAQDHLAHAESRSPDPCPCYRCKNDRENAARQAEWKAQAEAAAKERKAHEREQARLEAAERRRIARLPRARFECPNDCNPEMTDDGWQVSPIYPEGKGATRWSGVECADCGNEWDLSTVTHTRLDPAPGQMTIAAA